jgi:DNA-binding NtrC family response regulator
MSSKMNIAIVDDEVQILNMLEKFFTKNSNYKVSTFSNPISALGSIKSGSFDIVLLDIMMPQKDGLEVLKEIKAATPETKVLMMTAYSSLDRVLDSHKIGAEGYVMKPFESLMTVEKKLKEIVNA